jgi:hypothetical protein
MHLPFAVIASAAKQSLAEDALIEDALIVTDCFFVALLAMTAYGSKMHLPPRRHCERSEAISDRKRVD